MVANENIRLLSIYYSAQSLFKNDLSAPLMKAVRPVINVNEHSLVLLVDKMISYLDNRVSYKRVAHKTNEIFNHINSGQIKPEKILGHHFDTEKIIHSCSQHDTFKALYKGFFDEIALKNQDCLIKVRDQIMTRIDNNQFDLNNREQVLLKKALVDYKKRVPLSIEIHTMKNIVDEMHQSVTDNCGPAFADLMLSSAEKSTQNIPLKFKAKYLM